MSGEEGSLSGGSHISSLRKHFELTAAFTLVRSK